MTKRNSDRLPKSPMIYMTDVSSAETDDTCGMRFWYNKLEGGRGIMKEDSVVGHLLDVEIHNDLRTLAAMPDISPIAIQAVIDDILSNLSPDDKQDIRKMELLYRRLGWLAAFAIYMEPAIRAEYDSIPLDPMLVLDKSPLWIASYPDRLLQHKTSKEIVLREYVPMGAGLTSERWLQGWHYNIRIHVALAAAQYGVSDPTLVPNYGQVMSLAQGYRSVLNNRLCHPYVWGWYNKARQEWAPSQTNRVGDWEMAPVWDYPGGIVSWIRMCGEGTAKNQFQLTSAIFLQQAILDTWVGRRLHREREIEGVREGSRLNRHLRGIYFSMVTNQCYPVNGDICPYVHACWDKQINPHPLGSNLYVPRDPLMFGDT